MKRRILSAKTSVRAPCISTIESWHLRAIECTSADIWSRAWIHISYNGTRIPLNIQASTGMSTRAHEPHTRAYAGWLRVPHSCRGILSDEQRHQDSTASWKTRVSDCTPLWPSCVPRRHDTLLQSDRYARSQHARTHRIASFPKTPTCFPDISQSEFSGNDGFFARVIKSAPRKRFARRLKGKTRALSGSVFAINHYRRDDRINVWPELYMPLLYIGG